MRICYAILHILLSMLPHYAGALSTPACICCGRLPQESLQLDFSEQGSQYADDGAQPPHLPR